LYHSYCFGLLAHEVTVNDLSANSKLASWKLMVQVSTSVDCNEPF
jgi:hypothetical protein